jgi:hypothetical protein
MGDGVNIDIYLNSINSQLEKLPQWGALFSHTKDHILCIAQRFFLFLIYPFLLTAVGIILTQILTNDWSVFLDH